MAFLFPLYSQSPVLPGGTVGYPAQPGEMAKLFCMQFVLHADMLFLQCSAVLYPAEHFCENGRHFPFNS
jgi:hypothetical protein